MHGVRDHTEPKVGTTAVVAKIYTYNKINNNKKIQLTHLIQQKMLSSDIFHQDLCQPY